MILANSCPLCKQEFFYLKKINRAKNLIIGKITIKRKMLKFENLQESKFNLFFFAWYNFLRFEGFDDFCYIDVINNVILCIIWLTSLAACLCYMFLDRKHVSLNPFSE